jgi:hypothetical protein
VDKIYHTFLWLMGFKTGEHISDMLARQKKRIGRWWWLLPITTIFSTLLLLVFEFYLTAHIATFKLKKN